MLQQYGGYKQTSSIPSKSMHRHSSFGANSSVKSQGQNSEEQPFFAEEFGDGIVHNIYDDFSFELEVEYLSDDDDDRDASVRNANEIGRKQPEGPNKGK